MTKLSKLYKKQVFIDVGTMRLGSGFTEGKLWLENELGESTEIPIEDLENGLKCIFENEM